MLKLIIYKKKACIYLVGGTTDRWETADLIEKLIKEN